MRCDLYSYPAFPPVVAIRLYTDPIRLWFVQLNVLPHGRGIRLYTERGIVAGAAGRLPVADCPIFLPVALLFFVRAGGFLPVALFGAFGFGRLSVAVAAERSLSAIGSPQPSEVAEGCRGWRWPFFGRLRVLPRTGRLLRLFRRSIPARVIAHSWVISGSVAVCPAAVGYGFCGGR